MGKRFDPKIQEGRDDPERRADRLWTAAEAQAIAQAIAGQHRHRRVQAQHPKKASPLLFDLTSCSARPTRASASRPRPRWRWPRPLREAQEC